MKYSLIIPVYNRPDELDELLQSIAAQTVTDLEVIVVEDGSSCPSDQVAAKYAGVLDIKYFQKPNSGPGPSRNYGALRSQGEYLIVLDSDCVLPPTYLAAIQAELAATPADAFGGPDRAHPSFTPLQKAISYSMTSFLTTGGIRGSRRRLDRFYPRSFNMGLSSTLWQRLGGFSGLRFGEDIDLSIRIYQSGAHCRLFPQAWVWHKRRTDFGKFWRQVFNSGMARINLYRLHPTSLRLVHLLPAAFTLGSLALLLAATASIAMGYTMGALLALAPLALYALLLFLDAWHAHGSARVGLLGVWAAVIQLTGYGCGFLCAWWRRCVLRQGGEARAFEQTFYK